jgi:HEAT repeat protein
MASSRLASPTTLARRARHLAAGALVTTFVITGTARISPAMDPAAATRDLASDADFRVRMTAALYLGKARPAGAREALEHALSDSHPSVRNAAAVALGTLGDPAAIAALQKQKAREASPSVKAQMEASIESLKKAADAVAHVKLARVVVRLGSMHNNTAVRGDALGTVLAVAARTRAASVPGLMLTEDEAVMREAVSRKIPVVILDGSVTDLKEGRDKGNVTFRAQVEFSVRRDQALRGTLRGAATSTRASWRCRTTPSTAPSRARSKAPTPASRASSSDSPAC